MDEKVWIVGYNWIFVLSLIMTGEVKAACTPKPDCEAIGYTKTSCETDYLACPFDSTKLKCMPCDSSFKYDCTGDNITAGVGTSCNGKYVSCTCSDAEYTFSNGECIGPKCSVGYIYYSDKSCSGDLDNGKIAIGIVVKSDKYITALNVPAMRWASHNSTDVSDITNISSSATVNTDYNGKANTLAIISAYPSDTTSNNAAVYCNSYSAEGTNAGDWYLPTAGEVYDYIYSNYAKVIAGWYKVGITISKENFWSSSEKDTINGWYVSSGYNLLSPISKNNALSVACLLAIN